jgi:hypothetical protein
MVITHTTTYALKYFSNGTSGTQNPLLFNFKSADITCCSSTSNQQILPAAPQLQISRYYLLLLNFKPADITCCSSTSN